MENLYNNDGQYLVHGARLKCSKMKKEEGQKLVYKEELNSEPVLRKGMMDLYVTDTTRKGNDMGLPFANVSDTTGGMRGKLLTKGEELNITSFGNCKFLDEENLKDVEAIAKRVYRAYANSSEFTGITYEMVLNGIIEAIRANMGTCYCCMALNYEWENLPVEFDYVDNTFSTERSGAESYFKFNGKDGINMMSMLFCGFGGGIINAEESGQINIYNCYNGELVYKTASGAKLITDVSLNPRGIPLYNGRTMNGQYKYCPLETYSQAQYSKVAITTDKTWLEGASYKYIHPAEWEIELPDSFNQAYHGTFTSNGSTFSMADNRIEIACRRGISTYDGESFDETLAGKYIDIVLSDGTVIACILGGSKGDEKGSDPTGVVHHDGSIIELLATKYEGNNADKEDILHGCDIVGAYVYSGKRLYDSTAGEYTYYFSEGIDD